MLTAIKKCWRRVSRRGAVLLFLALLDVLYAANLAWPPPAATRPASTAFAATLAPLWMWASLWAAVGAVCLAGAFVRTDRWAFAAASGLKVLWGSVFGLGWVIADLDRGWVSAVIWLAFAALIHVVGGWADPVRDGDRL